MKKLFIVSHITANEPKDTEKEYLLKGFINPEDHWLNFNRIELKPVMHQIIRSSLIGDLK